jgi:hypothetical protein
MQDADGNIIAGARLEELDELVMRLPRGNAQYCITFEGNGAMTRIASFHACISTAEEAVEKLRRMNPDFVIRIRPTSRP